MPDLPPRLIFIVIVNITLFTTLLCQTQKVPNTNSFRYQIAASNSNFNNFNNNLIAMNKEKREHLQEQQIYVREKRDTNFKELNNNIMEENGDDSNYDKYKQSVEYMKNSLETLTRDKDAILRELPLKQEEQEEPQDFSNNLMYNLNLQRRRAKRHALLSFLRKKRQHDFLDNYKISDNMKSLLENDGIKMRRRKRSHSSSKRKIRKEDLVKLEMIIRTLASNMRKELLNQNKAMTKRQSNKVKRRFNFNNNNNFNSFLNDDTNTNTKVISKNDLENMIKTIVKEEEHEEQKQQKQQDKDLSLASSFDLSKNLQVIEDIKRSLKSSTEASTTAGSLFSLDFRYTTQDLLHVFTTPRHYQFLDEQPVKRTDDKEAAPPPAPSNPGSPPQQQEQPPKNDHEIMQKILQDVESIKGQKEGPAAPKGAFPCNVEGSWTSTMGGKVLQISTNVKNVLLINQTDSIPPREGFLNNPTWKLCGTSPFPNTGLLLVTGINEPCRQVAAFVGECKFCEGKEVIQGQWLVGKLAKDCSDIIASQDVIGDVWKKEVLHELRKKRLGLG